MIKDGIEVLTDSEDGPRKELILYRDMTEQVLRSLVLSGDVNAALESSRRKGGDRLIAACYSAACRPPISGGTGGSLPAGVMSAKRSQKIEVSPGKFAKVHENVEDIAFPRHRVSAFGRRLQEAIDAEPALQGRLTLRRHRERIEATNAAMLDSSVSRMQYELREWEGTRFELATGARNTVTGEWTPNMVREKILYEIEIGLEKGLHHKYMDDPDLRPPADSSNQEWAMWHIASDHREALKGARTSSTRLGLLEQDGIRIQMNWDGLPISITHRSSGLPFRMTKNQKLDDPSITPEFEAASTRVGKVVLEELKSRIAPRTAESERRRTEVLQKIAEIAGVSPDVVTIHNKSVRIVKSGGLPDEQNKQILDLIASSGVHFSDPVAQARLDLTRNTRVAFMEVMEEARTVGGVIHGTPMFKASASGGSSHETVIQGTARYPSTWIQASNDNGQVQFKTGTGRGSYTSSKSEIVHDGYIGTMVHEIGHRFEDTVPGLKQLEAIFWNRRTDGEVSQSLTKLVPGSGYDFKELARADQFFMPYAGRDYKGVAYEVFTMGIEQAATAGYNSPNPFDDDHASFVLGALTTLLPEG